MTMPTTTRSLNDHRMQLPNALADRLVARISAEHPELTPPPPGDRSQIVRCRPVASVGAGRVGG